MAGRLIKLGGLAALGAGALASAGAPRPAASIVAPLPIPALFSPLDERAASLTADGDTAYFPVRIGDGYRTVLCVVRRIGGRWRTPEVLPFSGSAAFDGDPFVTPDGKALYFASTRQAGGGDKRDLDLWVTERDGSGWRAPHPVAGVNTAGNERSPVLAPSGRLYFVATRDGRAQAFSAAPKAGGFDAPAALDGAINAEGDIATLAIDPAEDEIVYAASGREDEILAPGQIYPRGDLYLSRRTATGWSAGRHLPAPINSAASDLAPAFSKDGRWLYFMSERGFATDQRILLTPAALARGRASSLNGRGNLYRVDVRALEAAR